MESAGKRPPTLLDVANRAKVSKKTVSRVINDQPGVGPQAREFIKQIIKEMNFHPNMNARRLAGDRSFLIGLFVENPGSYVTEFQLGVAARCRESDFHLIVEPWQPSEISIHHNLRPRLRQLKLEGAILLPPLCDNALILEMLSEENVPQVRIAPVNERPDSPVVVMDDYAAARRLTAHLLDFGHRRIGFIWGCPDHCAAQRRYQAFVDEMGQRGLSVDQDLVVPGNFRFEQGVIGAEHLLQRSEPPTAIIASNDDVAVAVFSVASRLGLRIPTDLSVTGFDDTPSSRMTWPQITTIRQPVFEMARVAAGMIIDFVPGRSGWPSPMPGKVMDFDFLIRESTGAARV